MDANLAGVVAAVLGVAFVAILWVRTRAFEVLAVEQSASRIEATRQAIDAIDERLSSLSGAERPIAGVADDVEAEKLVDATPDLSESGAWGAGITVSSR